MTLATAKCPVCTLDVLTSIGQDKARKLFKHQVGESWCLGSRRYIDPLKRVRVGPKGRPIVLR